MGEVSGQCAPQATATRPLTTMAAAEAARLLDLAQYTLVATRSNEASGRQPGGRPESTLDGIAATTLVCWPYVTARGPCPCGGALAHICAAACGGAVNAALGGRHVCRKKACPLEHPSPEDVRSALEAWWLATHGRAPVWSVVPPPAVDSTGHLKPPALKTVSTGTADPKNARSVETSSASAPSHSAQTMVANRDEQRRCTVPVDVQLERLRRHSSESISLTRFLSEPFLDAILGEEALRMLLAMRKCAKEVGTTDAQMRRAHVHATGVPPRHEHEPEHEPEPETRMCALSLGARVHVRTYYMPIYVCACAGDGGLWRGCTGDACPYVLHAHLRVHVQVTEAYGAAAQAISLLRALGRSGDQGEGAVLLDVCSGKGLTAVLLSFLLPEASIILFDSNPDMDLAHVAVRPNLRFEPLDLFAVGALRTVDAAAATGSACVAIGTHLCGALSPRLIDLALRAPAVHGLVLSPCCLRGALGALALTLALTLSLTLARTLAPSGGARACSQSVLPVGRTRCERCTSWQGVAPRPDD